MFWHTQGSGKSYSMAFFTEKVRRKVAGNFTFLLMTDRHDLDDQIYKTFAGSGITGKETPRAATGDDLERLLKENHPYIFSLIHKFNRDVDPKHPYSERDDIIVVSDEAHLIKHLAVLAELHGQAHFDHMTDDVFKLTGQKSMSLR